MKYPFDFQKRLSKFLDYKGVTRYRLMKETGLSRNTVYNQYEPTMKSVRIALEWLGVEYDAFFSRSEPKELETEVSYSFLTGEELTVIELYNQVPEQYRERVLGVMEHYIAKDQE